MRLVTWNVNSVRARLERVLPWLRDSRPDVVALQEIKCLDEQFPREPIEDLGYQVETFGQKTYNGVALLSRRPIEDVQRGMADGVEDAEARVLSARIGGIAVVDVYVVNGKAVGDPKYDYKLAWMERLRKHLAERFDATDRVVVTGDFNVTFDDLDVHDPEAWRDQILCSQPERDALGRIVELGYADALRTFHPEGGVYTWWDFRTRAYRRDAGLRIDHFLVTEPVLAQAKGAWVDREAREGEKPSDHAPVWLELG